MPYEWINTALNAITVVIVCIGIPIYKHLAKIRFNELKHIEGDIASIKHELELIRNALGEHIAYHLNHIKRDQKL